MIFNFDSDNVIYDWVPTYAFYLNKSRGGGPYTKTPSTYRVYEEWGISSDEFMAVMEENAYAIFSNGEELPGAVDTIIDLNRRGHDVRVVTHKRWEDYPTLTEKAIRGTLDWYGRRGLVSLVDMVFTAGSKQSYPADVVIDDKPDLKWYQPEALNLLFGRSWNTEVSGVQRVKSWTEVRTILNRIGAL